MARFTMIFARLEEVALYAERKEVEFPVRDGITEVLATIQRIVLVGFGHAQGILDSGERFSELNLQVRVDAPLGQSHQWVDPAGGERFFHAEYHADHFAIMGQGMVDMALRAQTHNHLELWVKNRWDQQVRLRRPPILAERIVLDLAYFPDTSGLEFMLRRP